LILKILGATQVTKNIFRTDNHRVKSQAKPGQCVHKVLQRIHVSLINKNIVDEWGLVGRRGLQLKHFAEILVSQVSTQDYEAYLKNVGGESGLAISTARATLYAAIVSIRYPELLDYIDELYQSDKIIKGSVASFEGLNFASADADHDARLPMLSTESNFVQCI
jgi:hypothetical protein